MVRRDVHANRRFEAKKYGTKHFRFLEGHEKPRCSISPSLNISFLIRANGMFEHTAPKVSGDRGGREERVGFHAVDEGSPSREDQMRQNFVVRR